MVGWYSVGDADFASVWYTKAGYRTKWIDPEYESAVRRGPLDQRRGGAGEGLSPDDGNPRISRTRPIFLFGLPSLYGVGNNITGFGAAADKMLRLTQVHVK